ncbi:ligase-associated DNA damage response endonuclease PdeM [Roseibium denhamense]|uniref:Phosphoesterase n=1 Tax=Roseibium denhamense TaxID=76305 RepID=A0ABY1P6J4_9HYPH|nr:ligase-associated DNA damage response endonuclease PdeM [Roseibium denhamense]MTI07237.1 ligase-associated DNA damage response endonuclease PdeM [Roseibium denhamense]SMP26342.1 putative phosphoesterase [Roseibium denhamense]
MSALTSHLRKYASAPVCHDIQINGQLVGLHDSGVLWWPEESTLVVADLHLEKGSSYARRGVMLPPYDTGATLEKLAGVMDAFDPARVICLGDSFHDAGGSDRLPAHYRAMLTTLQLGREWIWVTGNHDPVAPVRLCGETVDQVELGPLKFRHEPVEKIGSEAAEGEICGHLHPAARVRRFGRSIRRPCFTTDGTRMVLPAFGALTGGLNVTDEAFGMIFRRRQFSVFMLGNDRLFPFTASRLVAD